MNNADLIAEFEQHGIETQVCKMTDSFIVWCKDGRYMQEILVNRDDVPLEWIERGGKVATIDARWQVSELIKSIYERQNR